MTLHSFVSSTAIELPKVTVTQPFGQDCDVYKVMEKMFMLTFHLDKNAVVNLKVEPDHGAMLRDIYPYIRTGWHMNKQHWISIYDHEDLDFELVKDLVLNSYELVISKLKKVEKRHIESLRNL